MTDCDFPSYAMTDRIQTTTFWIKRLFTIFTA